MNGNTVIINVRFIVGANVVIHGRPKYTILSFSGRGMSLV